MESLNDRNQMNLRNPYVTPSTEVERRIAEIWQELLRIQPVGIHDNFIRLGAVFTGHSADFACARAAFQVDLPLVALFEAPTVASLSQFVEEMLFAEVEELSEEETKLLTSRVIAPPVE